MALISCHECIMSFRANDVTLCHHHPPPTHTEVDHTAAILESILDELSWPEDAEHILRLQNTLDIIHTGSFRKLASLTEKGVVVGSKEVCCSIACFSMLYAYVHTVHQYVRIRMYVRTYIQYMCMTYMGPIYVCVYIQYIHMYVYGPYIRTYIQYICMYMGPTYVRTYSTSVCIWALYTYVRMYSTYIRMYTDPIIYMYVRIYSTSECIWAL